MNTSFISFLGFSVLFALLAYSHAAPTDLALRDSSELAELKETGSTRVKRGGGCGCGCCGGGCGCCCCRPRCCCRCCCCKTCCCTRCCTCCKTCCRPCCCRPCCGCGCGCGCGGGRKRRSLQKLAVKLAEKKMRESSPVVEAVESVPAVVPVESAPSSASNDQEKPVEKRSLRWSPLQAIADITLW